MQLPIFFTCLSMFIDTVAYNWLTKHMRKKWFCLRWCVLAWKKIVLFYDIRTRIHAYARERYYDTDVDILTSHWCICVHWHLLKLRPVCIGCKTNV